MIDGRLPATICCVELRLIASRVYAVWKDGSWAHWRCAPSCASGTLNVSTPTHTEMPPMLHQNRPCSTHYGVRRLLWGACPSSALQGIRHRSSVFSTTQAGLLRKGRRVHERSFVETTCYLVYSGKRLYDSARLTSFPHSSKYSIISGRREPGCCVQNQTDQSSLDIVSAPSLRLHSPAPRLGEAFIDE